MVALFFKKDEQSRITLTILAYVLWLFYGTVYKISVYKITAHKF